MILTECYGALSCNISSLLTVNVLSQYRYTVCTVCSPLCEDQSLVKPHTPTDQSNIFCAHKSIKRSPTHTECQKTKSKSYQLREREREREREGQSSVFLQMKCWQEEHKIWRCQERTATEDTTQSALCSLRCLLSYVCSCSQLSTSTAGLGQVKPIFTLERLTGCCCKEVNGSCLWSVF